MRAEKYERHSRELAVISSAAFGYQRPRVAAVVGLSPLEVAGGHSFITDLIEIAGGESVTHGNHDLRVPMSRAELLATAPDLVVVISSSAMSDLERRQATELLGAPEVGYLGYLTLDSRRFWLRSGLERAQEMRDLVEPLVAGRLAPIFPADDLQRLPARR